MKLFQNEMMMNVLVSLNQILNAFLKLKQITKIVYSLKVIVYLNILPGL